MITVLAGKLTPQARVAVETKTLKHQLGNDDLGALFAHQVLLINTKNGEQKVSTTPKLSEIPKRP